MSSTTTRIAATPRSALSKRSDAARSAASCEEAIAVLDAGAHVDLVFSDVVMPKSTGVTLARLVRERDPSMPVVLATGYAEAVETATECGAIPLIKPYSMARLEAVLGEQLRVRGTPPS